MLGISSASLNRTCTETYPRVVAKDNSHRYPLRRLEKHATQQCPSSAMHLIGLNIDSLVANPQLLVMLIINKDRPRASALCTTLANSVSSFLLMVHLKRNTFGVAASLARLRADPKSDLGRGSAIAASHVLTFTAGRAYSLQRQYAFVKTTTVSSCPSLLQVSIEGLSRNKSSFQDVFA